MVKLGFSIGDLNFKNPVLTASGTFGNGSEFDDFIDVSELGGIILKEQLWSPEKETNTLVWLRLLPGCSMLSDCKIRESIISNSLFTPVFLNL